MPKVRSVSVDTIVAGYWRVRSWIWSLETIDGFHMFVCTIVGLWQWDSLSKAGCEPSVSHSHISFNDCQYRVTAVLCRCQVVRAQVTNVFVAELDEALQKPTDQVIQTRSQVRDNMTLLDGKELEPWFRLSPFGNLVPLPPSATKQIAPIQLPNTFIVKCSHQPDGRHKEEDVFHSVQGLIGIPQILGGYEAEQFNIPTEHTALEWDIISRDKVGLDSDDSDDSFSDGYRRGSGRSIDHHEDSDNTEDGDNDGDEHGGSDVDQDDRHQCRRFGNRGGKSGSKASSSRSQH